MEAVLEAVRRDTFGRRPAGRLRREGRIPAVVYGGGSEPQSVAVSPKDLLRILRSESGANTIITMRVEGGEEARVLVKDYQIDPVKHELLHADFFRVAMDRKVKVTVPIVLTGDAKTARTQGGTVDFVTREIEVECLPGDIPEHITIDISEMGLHDVVRVKDLDTGGKWTPLVESDLLIVHVVAPRTAEESGAEGAAEPVVIKKGKAEKDEK
jgi:large subunit ribosomal protein L25